MSKIWFPVAVVRAGVRCRRTCSREPIVRTVEITSSPGDCMQSYSITGQPPMNISIDGSDSSFVTLDRDHDEDGRYESAVVRWLEQLAATASGRTILAAIQGFNPIRLTII